MANEQMLMGLLKTPSQVRRDEQQRMMEESVARSQQMLTRGGTTALPGIISAYGAQAAQRATQAGAGLLRGVSGGIGSMVGGETGQRIADLGISAEESQARAQQEALRGFTVTPEGLRTAIKRLQETGAPPEVIARLQEKLTELENKTVKPPKTREVKKGDEIITEEFDDKTGTWSEIGRAPRFQEREAKEPSYKVEVGSDSQYIEVLQGNKTFSDTIKSMASRPRDFFGSDVLRSIGIDPGKTTDEEVVNGITAEVVRRAQELQRNSDTPMSMTAAVAQALEEQFSQGSAPVASGQLVQDANGKWVRKD